MTVWILTVGKVHQVLHHLSNLILIDMFVSLKIVVLKTAKQDEQQEVGFNLDVVYKS